MAKATLDRKLDVRPDQLELKEREYQPPLVSLPDEYPSAAAQQDFMPLYGEMILDQGKGACTGFGLACVINFLQWSRQFRPRALLGLKFRPPQLVAKVSPRMLYHLARFYDEWPGEDYEGSSCRGAMKGWHRHGVCSEELWPYSDEQGKGFVPPKDGWQLDAARRTLGAYYRINRQSVSDMQAAVYETGAIYVSAQVHAGWTCIQCQRHAYDLVQHQPGGHAFAIVGYTPRGFIVQNSWGEDWGFHGFAILPYEDWVQNGMDAWAAAWECRRAPQTCRVAAAMCRVPFFRGGPWRCRSQRLGWKWFFGGRRQGHSVQVQETQRGAVERLCAFHHMLVMGNNGLPLNRLVSSENAEAAVEEVCKTLPGKWLAGQTHKKLVIYANGGLNWKTPL